MTGFARFSHAAAKSLLRKKRLFRSFRTYMSIETRVVPFSRSFRSLRTCEHALQMHIKVLQTLGVFARRGAIDIKVLRT